jgi:hypothetical protein
MLMNAYKYVEVGVYNVDHEASSLKLDIIT